MDIPKFGLSGVSSIPSTTSLHLRETHVTFLCIGKNVEKSIRGILRQIDELGALFGAYDVIFVDGDSTDNTKQIFENYSFQRTQVIKTVFITVPSENLVEVDGPFKGFRMPREGRIAIARNEGLRVLNNASFINSTFYNHYVVMIDADILGWDTHGVIDTFGKRAYWDVVCANGVMFNGIYRDTYAFRTSELETNHHWTGADLGTYNISEDYLKPKSISTARKHLRHMQLMTRKIMEYPMRGNVPLIFSMNAIPLPSNLVTTDSCFAGLAIYKSEIIKNCKYDYRHKEPPHMLDCEHVLFHECVRVLNKARVTTNPDMKLWYGHSIFQKGLSKIYGETLKYIWCSIWNKC